LLIEADGAEIGDVDMAVGRKESNQRQQQAGDDGDPPLLI